MSAYALLIIYQPRTLLGLGLLILIALIALTIKVEPKLTPMLNGYKTYLLALAAVAYAVGGFFSGNLDGKGALDIIWAALVAASVRHGVSTQA